MNGANSDSSFCLTESERLRRVAEILCKVILLAEADAALHVPDASEPAEPATRMPDRPPGDHPADEQILRYLALVGEASPVKIRSTLSLSRSSACRALQRLAQTRRIRGSGRTRQLVYQLSGGEPPPDKIGLN